MVKKRVTMSKKKRWLFYTILPSVVFSAIVIVSLAYCFFPLGYRAEISFSVSDGRSLWNQFPENNPGTEYGSNPIFFHYEEEDYSLNYWLTTDREMVYSVDRDGAEIGKLRKGRKHYWYFGIFLMEGKLYYGMQDYREVKSLFSKHTEHLYKQPMLYKFDLQSGESEKISKNEFREKHKRFLIECDQKLQTNFDKSDAVKDAALEQFLTEESSYDENVYKGYGYDWQGYLSVYIDIEAQEVERLNAESNFNGQVFYRKYFPTEYLDRLMDEILKIRHDISFVMMGRNDMSCQVDIYLNNRQDIEKINAYLIEKGLYDESALNYKVDPDMEVYAPIAYLIRLQYWVIAFAGFFIAGIIMTVGTCRYKRK